MRRGVRNVLFAQGILTLIAAFLMIAIRSDVQSGLAAGYGGAMALTNTLLLARRTRRVGKHPDSPRQLQTLGLMAGVVERFLFTLVAFGLGMGIFQLDPLALLAGFACAQLGYLAAGEGMRFPSATAVNERKRQRFES